MKTLLTNFTEKRLHNRNFIVFASFITILYIANTFILSIIFISTNLRQELFMNINLGFLLGLGVGLGLEFSEFLIDKKIKVN